jgi:hypothetical protein
MQPQNNNRSFEKAMAFFQTPAFSRERERERDYQIVISKAVLIDNFAKLDIMNFESHCVVGSESYEAGAI